MNSNNRFGRSPAQSLTDIYRPSRLHLDIAKGALDHGAHIKQLLDQDSWQSKIIRDLQRDPLRDTVTSLAKRFQADDGLRSTMRAIQEAQRHRELTVKALAGTDLLKQQQIAATALDTGILRTVETMAKNQNAIVAAIAGTRRLDEMAGLASSIVRQMDTLRYAELGRAGLSKPLAAKLAEEFATARDATADLEVAATDEERAALLTKLFGAVLSLLRVIASNTKKEVRTAGLILLFSLTADVNSFIPHDPPPGMTPAQVQMLEETHRTAETLQREFKEYIERDRKLDEAYVSNLPRAELARPAIIRAEPNGKGKALWRAPADTVLAVAERRGRWTLATYRDPLTDELAQGWIYGTAVRLLDTP